MNCFVNVCLQALWVFPQVRLFIKQFSEVDSKGPEKLAPLIGAIKLFFSTVQNLQLKEKGKFHVLSALEVRRELFKLHYPSSSFDLNQKADAFEAFDQILTHIGEWTANGKQNSDCFIHDAFFLKRLQSEVCQCGKSSKPVPSDANLFAETINVP